MTDETSPVAIERQGEIALLRLNRPAKRNAVDDAMIEALGAWFAKPPEGVKVAVLTAAGEHFSAGLDLAEHLDRSAFEVMRHSRRWHEILDRVQFGGLPMGAALQGGVIGAATHVRLAEASTFFQLPEGRRSDEAKGRLEAFLARQPPKFGA